MIHLSIILVGLTALLLVILSLNWCFRFQGSFHLDPDKVAFSGGVIVGSRRGGFGLIYEDGSRSLIFGSLESPRVKLRIPRRAKPDKKKWGIQSFLPKRWGGLRTIPIGSLATRIRRSVSWESFGLDGQIGLDDPSVTGRVFGVMTALANLVPVPIRTIDLIPSFGGTKVALNCRTTLRFRPAVLLWRVGPVLLKAKRD